MRWFAILIAVTASTSAQQMVEPAVDYHASPMSPRYAAQLKCFQDAPWAEPGGYHDSCLAKTGHLSDAAPAHITSAVRCFADGKEWIEIGPVCHVKPPQQ
jgi:hypothetical protein